jgi:hypothetical protein
MISTFNPNSVTSLSLDDDPSEPRTQFLIKPMPYGAWLDIESRRDSLASAPEAKDDAEQRRHNSEWSALFSECLRASLVGVVNGGGSLDGIQFPLTTESVEVFHRTNVSRTAKLSSGKVAVIPVPLAAVLFGRIMDAQTLTLPERRSLLGAGVGAGGPERLRPAGEAPLPGA